MATTKVKRPVFSERGALQAIIDRDDVEPKQRLLAKMSLYVLDFIATVSTPDEIMSPSAKILSALEKKD